MPDESPCLNHVTVLCELFYVNPCRHWCGIRGKQLVSVSDTLPGGQRVGGKGLFQWFLRGMDPGPRGPGVGFSWVLGLRALELRGIENVYIVFTL